MDTSQDVGDCSRLLLVEDDAVLREATQLALERYGYDVRTAVDGLAGWEEFQADAPQVAVLDVMLPNLDGIELCRRIRGCSHVPVLMLSARTDPLDVVQGLEAGADDYVVKPFDTSVLVARIRSVVRRLRREPAPASAVRTFGDLEVDLDSLEVRRAGRSVPLTPTELRLVLEFAAQPGVVLTRSALLERVWDYAWGGDTRVVDVHVQRLRAKIGRERVETVRGFGYKLVPG
ncbi:DNA-binding response OmpR family regulator [Saccharopolyspora erythraea NRRL 2338]|uniref:Two-component system response regulator CseB n=1 Tax=Saccharopolyspora erythraea TaxID=1836 RepID=A0ABN1D4C4_SACER|nr:two-component system response regulator CseB [Saccharopolyspora erythraea]EQD88031.1 transcriptional regulator [Saccharopolyspora erythraea D]PFG93343.1 DNA-binding response OmpR family regulator [Saccharopolyspora erythraea NRRL 2338]